MATAGSILTSARTHLNDDLAAIWQDQRLLPKLREAQKTLQLHLMLSGIELYNEVSDVLTVPANTTDGVAVDLTSVSGYPSDLVEPIWMKERLVGQLDINFTDMIELEYIAPTTKGTTLRYWAWRKQKIYVPGAVNDVQVLIRYKRSLALVSKLTDTVEPLQCEAYLSYKTASLVLLGTTEDAKGKSLSDVADSNLDLILRINIKGQQNKPTRRLGYHTKARAYQGIR